MLDFNHILATPGLDVQYFTGQGGYFGPITSVVLNTNITAVTIADTAGTLTVTAGNYIVGQPITISGTLTAGTINGTANYTTPVTFYIITVNNSTSIVISSSLGGAAVTSTTGTATPGGVFSMNGVLTVTAVTGGYQIGQPIVVSGTLSAGTISGTANYTTPVTFYIVGIASATVITISATPDGVPVLSTAGTATTGGVFTLQNRGWQTWRKPRGVKNVYMIGVGGGSSGAVGTNVAATNVGGAGGGSGGQTCVWIPAFFVPDTLYVQCGAGGKHPTTLWSGAPQHGGGPTYVAIEPSTTVTTNMTLLLAHGGVTAAVSGGTLATIAGMPLAARGYYTLFAGHPGTAGGAVGNGNGGNQTFPVSGVMVMGGSGGGGGGSATGGVGGALSVPVGSPYNDFFLFTYPGGTAATGSTPAGAGYPGAIMRNFIMNYGGMGGGGAGSASGAIAGAGGNGAPGSGGGGSGGSTTVAGASTLARPGNGGDGFVIILSW